MPSAPVATNGSLQMASASFIPVFAAAPRTVVPADYARRRAAGSRTSCGHHDTVRLRSSIGRKTPVELANAAGPAGPCGR